ncbi:MAG: hypothetical protein LKJ90_05185 [Faecalibacterium sp.]|nr:hypothetical protein [Faecalibacterium sp.]
MQMQTTSGVLTRLAGLYLGPQAGAKENTAQGSMVLQTAAQNAAESKPTDTLTLSEEARAYLQSDTKAAAASDDETAEAGSTQASSAANGEQTAASQDTAEDDSAEKQSLREQFDAADAEAKAEADKWEEKLKCLKIMANMVSGKAVPTQDQQYLCKHDTEMYAKALTLRAVAPHSRQKAKQVTDDEDFAGSAALQADAETGESSASAATDVAALLQNVSETSSAAAGAAQA